MIGLNVVDALRYFLAKEPSVRIEEAAEMCGLSTRTIRRKIHLFECHRGAKGHIFITRRSIARFLARERYQPSPDYDATRGLEL